MREPHACVWRLYQRLIALRRRELKPPQGTAAIDARALDPDTLMIERVPSDGRVALCVARLRGRGPIDDLPTFGRGGAGEVAWSIRCSTEERRYVCHPYRLRWGIDRDRHWVEFERPGALLMIGSRE